MDLAAEMATHSHHWLVLVAALALMWVSVGAVVVTWKRRRGIVGTECPSHPASQPPKPLGVSFLLPVPLRFRPKPQ